MKFVAALLVTILNLSNAQTAHDHPSVHGMLMVGSEKVYLSHLPMFHSPHDYQVIFEAALPAEALDIYKTSLTSAGNEIFTLVPETFVLPDMAASPKAFKADIYKGHFERGGKKIASATIEIKTLYFKKFDPTAEKPETASFILFGNKQEQFMAHEIFAKPDFDQIVTVETITLVSNQLDSGKALIATVDTPNEPQNENTSPTLVIDGSGSIATIKKLIYTEFSDLSH